MRRSTPLYGETSVPLREPQGAFLNRPRRWPMGNSPRRHLLIMTIQQMMSRRPKKAGARLFAATPDGSGDSKQIAALQHRAEQRAEPDGEQTSEQDEDRNH
jgi:hypothetical protein